MIKKIIIGVLAAIGGLVVIAACVAGTSTPSVPTGSGYTQLPESERSPNSVPSVPYSAPQPQATEPDGFTDGVYEVPSEIMPGKWKTTGPEGNESWDMCYWSRLKDTSGDTGSIITNDLVKGQSTITISPKDAAIEFSGGCRWTKAS